MGGAEGTPPATTVVLRDAAGRPTTDPATAVQGEIVERDAHDHSERRTRFFLAERELPSWLPIGEAAFLIWVLVALMIVWLSVGLILVLT
jgi:hypothetical protein